MFPTAALDKARTYARQAEAIARYAGLPEEGRYPRDDTDHGWSQQSCDDFNAATQLAQTFALIAQAAR